MKLNEMRHLLTSEGIQLTKSLGQNFLHDANQLARIVKAADIQPSDRILEIGPGLGPLTQHLVKEAGAVFAIEKDKRLVDYLVRAFEANPAVTILHADALEYLRTSQQDWSTWKMVSNLPYSVASPILVELALSSFPPSRVVATLQLEVVQRLAANSGTEHYGVLTLLVQLVYEPAGMFKIPPGSFFPEPDVDSACITLVRRPTPLLPRELLKAYCKIVKRGFSQRRKMMAKLLKADWPVPVIESSFSELGLSPQIRAEKVSLDDFVRLTQLFTAKTGKAAKS